MTTNRAGYIKRRREERDERRANGFCIYCGKDVSEERPRHTRCKACRTKVSRRKRELAAEKREKG